MSPADTATRLAALLDRAGLAHAMHQAGGDQPWASLQCGIAGDAPLGMRAQVRGDILQFTAILPGNPAQQPDAWQLSALNALNARWPLGRACLDAEGTGYEAAEAILLEAGTAPPERLYLALDELADVARLIRSGWADAPDTGAALDTMLEAGQARVPEALGGSTLLDVEGLLTALGLRYRVADEGQTLLLVLHEAGQPGVGIELSKRDRRYLNLVAQHPVPARPADPVAALARLQAINRGVLCGSCVLDTEAGFCYFRVSLPLAFTTLDPWRLRWQIDHAAAVLERLDAATD